MVSLLLFTLRVRSCSRRYKFTRWFIHLRNYTARLTTDKYRSKACLFLQLEVFPFFLNGFRTYVHISAIARALRVRRGILVLEIVAWSGLIVRLVRKSVELPRGPCSNVSCLIASGAMDGRKSFSLYKKNIQFISYLDVDLYQIHLFFPDYFGKINIC